MLRIISLLLAAALMSAEISSAEVTTRLEISGDILVLSWSDSRDAVIFRRNSGSGYSVPPMKIDIPGKWTPDRNPDISRNKLWPGIIGQPYSYNLRKGSGQPVKWSANGLPDGLKCSQSGKISGTPKEAGVFSVDITAVSRTGKIVRVFPLKVFADSKPAVITGELPEGFVKARYESRLAFNDSPAGILMADDIPAGLAIDSSGRIYGVPEKAGSYVINVTAANSYGESSAKVTLKVSSTDKKLPEENSRNIPREKPKPPKISSTSLRQAFTGEEYRFTLKTSDSEPVKWSCRSLPEGLSLDSETGIISGIPVSDFRGKIIVAAMNDKGRSTRPLQFSIKTRKPKITTPELPEGFVSEDYRAILHAENEYGITWTFRGKIPEGLSFSKSGVIQGVPEKSGSFTINATVQNSGGKASRRFSLTVSENTPHEYVTAAVMPALTVSKDGRYDFPVSIDANIPEGSYIEWHSFPHGIESEGENYSFKDSRGKETLTVPADHNVTVSAYLEGGVRYEPLITARVKGEGNPAYMSQQGAYSGCNMAGITGIMILLQMILRKRK